MQGINTYMPETNHVSRVYNVAAIPRLLFMVTVIIIIIIAIIIIIIIIIGHINLNIYAV
jgi:hypothetical protein